MPEKREVTVEQARCTDVPIIHQTGEAAFEHDPLIMYLGDNRTLNPYLRRAIAYTEYSYYVHYYSAFTVDRGAAFTTIERPRPGKVRGGVKRILDAVVKDNRHSPEQRKRWKEFTDKMDAATKSVFGDDIENMLRLVYLATSPLHQGHGYGTALVEAVNAEADRLGCSSWLLSTNIANTLFYESCGFTVAKDIVMGDTNPAWKRPPFRILIMTRVGRSSIRPSNAAFDEKWVPL